MQSDPVYLVINENGGLDFYPDELPENCVPFCSRTERNKYGVKGDLYYYSNRKRNEIEEFILKFVELKKDKYFEYMKSLIGKSETFPKNLDTIRKINLYFNEQLKVFRKKIIRKVHSQDSNFDTYKLTDTE